LTTPARLDQAACGVLAKSTNNRVPEGPSSPFSCVTFTEPYVNLFANNPDATPYAAYTPHQQANAQNPLYILANDQINTDRTRYSAYGKANYRLTDWLSLEGHYNYDYEASNYSNLRPKGFLSASGIALDGNLTKTDSGGRE